MHKSSPSNGTGANETVKGGPAKRPRRRRVVMALIGVASAVALTGAPAFADDFSGVQTVTIGGESNTPSFSSIFADQNARNAYWYVNYGWDFYQVATSGLPCSNSFGQLVEAGRITTLQDILYPNSYSC